MPQPASAAMAGRDVIDAFLRFDEAAAEAFSTFARPQKMELTMMLHSQRRFQAVTPGFIFITPAFADAPSFSLR